MSSIFFSGEKAKQKGNPFNPVLSQSSQPATAMSEYRETTTIEDVTLPEPEPVVTLADLVARIDWNVATADLYSANRAMPANLPQPNIASMPPMLVDSALSSLLSSSIITVPLSEASDTSDRLKALASEGTAADLLRFGRELAVARQERLLGASLDILRESCLRSGFNEVRLHPKEGILVALESGTTHRAVIEIEKASRGQVGVNFDMDGFRGGVCVDRANAIATHASELGLKLDTRNRKRKADSPVADRRNLPIRTGQRNG